MRCLLLAILLSGCVGSMSVHEPQRACLWNDDGVIVNDCDRSVECGGVEVAPGDEYDAGCESVTCFDGGAALWWESDCVS